MTVCPTCDRDGFKNTHGMRIHHQRTHGESIAPDPDGPECPTCGDVFESEDGMKWHHAYQHDESLVETIDGVQCPSCERNDFETESDMKRHHAQVHGESLGRGVLVDCDYCGEEVRKERYRLERSENLFCSTECHDRWREENVSGSDAGGWDGGYLVEVACSWCNERFEKREDHVERYDKHFCDKECYSTWQYDTGIHRGKNNGMYGVTGSDHPAWKGGHDGSWRQTPEYRRMMKRVYRRDNFTCQDDWDSDDTELHGHHITPVSEGGAKFDEDNIVTLCADCHMRRHSN